MATNAYTRYAIGTPGQAWGEAERTAWRASQPQKRDYFNDVVSPLLRLGGNRTVFQYGSVDYRKYGAANFPLYAVKSANWCEERPMVVVTGGVHGYETSGVHGALKFIAEKMEQYSEKLNVLVLPCVSPWGYETVNRWTPDAVDPNRSFVYDKPGCAEAAHAMACTSTHAQRASKVLLHIDLHETTDTDNSEFTPAKSARDGDAELPQWEEIPDGFYLVGNEAKAHVEWHETMIAAVRGVTHIAPSDEKGELIGVKITKEGIIHLAAIGLCGQHTSAEFSTTTEVYPDSPKSSAEICNEAQVVCVTSGIDYAMKTL